MGVVAHDDKEFVKTDIAAFASIIGCERILANGRAEVTVMMLIKKWWELRSRPSHLMFKLYIDGTKSMAASVF